ncbi:MAG TPA: diacylglycerol kinase family protein [Longimicrobiales bacterium]
MASLPIILNPHSGRGAVREAEALRQAFEAVGTRAEIHVVEGTHVRDVVMGMASAHVPIIGIAGGDGTISSAATAVAETETALLPIPLGTFNHFAQRYGVPTVEAAVHAWERRSVHPVPVGFMNDVAFVNNASCGFYPHVVRQRDRIERFLPRKAAMWLAGGIVLAKLPLMRLELHANGHDRELKTPALWVGIGENSLRLPTPGDAHREGDVLEIVTPTTQRRISVIALMLRTMVKLKRGEETPEDKSLDVFHAEHFTINSPHRVDIGLDGEPLRMVPPIHFRYARNGLKVLCLVAP